MADIQRTRATQNVICRCDVLRVDRFDARDATPTGDKAWAAAAAAAATAVAEALSESLPRLMRSLVEAVFPAFPGRSGVTRQVEGPLREPFR